MSQAGHTNTPALAAYLEQQQHHHGAGYNGSFNFGVGTPTRPSAGSAGRSTTSPGSTAAATVNVNGSTFPINALKEISLSQLSQMSVPQLAQLQQQLSAMTQLSAMQQQQHSQGQTMDGVTAASVSIAGTKNEAASGSFRGNPRQATAAAPALHHLSSQPAHLQATAALYNSLSPTQHQLMAAGLSPIHSLSPTSAFPHHLLVPPAQGGYSNFGVPSGYMMPNSSSLSHLAAAPLKSVPAPRRNSRNSAGSRMSPTPFPTVNLKLKRKLRKNNREKQRRSEINDQFEILCQMLGLGVAVAGVTGSGSSSTVGTSASSVVGSSSTSVLLGGGAAGAQPKVEKFTILSEACHSITQLRLELAIYKSEKTDNRAEFAKLSDELDATFKSAGVATSAAEYLARFFPNLQRPDYVMPPSKAAQPKSAAMDSDEEGDGDEADGDKEMVQGPRRGSTGDATESHTTSPNTQAVVEQALPPPSSQQQAVAQQQQSAHLPPPRRAHVPVSASSVASPFSPPALPSPPNAFSYATHTDSSMGVSASSASPSLAVLLSSTPITTSPTTVRTRSGSISRGADPAVPTHRPRQHSRSNSSSALPRFGSNDFGSPPPAVVQAAKSSHSRQASHARSRSLQMLMNGVVKEEGDGILEKPTLEGGRTHSRNGSTSIPPPPSIPGVGPGIAPRLTLHSTANSMDLGFAASSMLHSPSNSSYPYFAGATPSKYAGQRVTGHVRHPSGSNSSALGGHHHRHRSTASIGGDLLFPTVNMEDDTELSVFETNYGH